MQEKEIMHLKEKNERLRSLILVLKDFQKSDKEKQKEIIKRYELKLKCPYCKKLEEP